MSERKKYEHKTLNNNNNNSSSILHRRDTCGHHSSAPEWETLQWGEQLIHGHLKGIAFCVVQHLACFVFKFDDIFLCKHPNVWVALTGLHKCLSEGHIGVLCFYIPTAGSKLKHDAVKRNTLYFVFYMVSWVINALSQCEKLYCGLLWRGVIKWDAEWKHMTSSGQWWRRDRLPYLPEDLIIFHEFIRFWNYRWVLVIVGTLRLSACVNR